jgi:hypothetical protein
MDTMRSITTGTGIGEQAVSEGLFSGLVALSEMRQLLDELYGSLERTPSWEDVDATPRDGVKDEREEKSSNHFAL